MRGTAETGAGLAINYSQPSWRKRLRLFLRDYRALTYAGFIDSLADIYEERTAFVLDDPIAYPTFSGNVLSYRTVSRLVDQFSCAMQRIGVERGARVGLITMNRIEMAFCNFAAGKIGAIPVPMSFMLQPTEIEHIVGTSDIKIIICDRAVWDGTIKYPANVPSVERWAMIGESDPPDPCLDLGALIEGTPAPVAPAEPASIDDTAVLFFTSGTTGLPKGAELSHEAVLVFLRHHGRFFALWPRLPRLLGLLVMPVAHAGGYAALMAHLTVGTPAFFLSRFEPEAIVDAIERHRPTLFSGTPAMYRMLLDAGALERDLTSVRIWAGGADTFSDDLIRTFRKAAARKWFLGLKRKPMFIRGYGMAESNAYLAQTPPFECGDNCLGWVLPPVQFRVVDPEGRDVPRGQEGELWVRGPNVASRYWKDPEATRGSFVDGWFRTGDLVRQGRWRMLYLVGRSHDVITSGGYKISAIEIDHVVAQHPDIDQVATVGIPDPVKGEMPVAAVTLRAGASATEEGIVEWLRERIAAYKRPRKVVVMPDMPVTFTLKPKRHEVRARVLATLSSQGSESQ